MKLKLIVAGLLMLAEAAEAQTNFITFTNKAGDVVSNAAVLSFNAVNVYYEIPGGGATVHLTDLPLNLQQRFGYDPNKANATPYRQQVPQFSRGTTAAVDAFLALHTKSKIDESWSSIDTQPNREWNTSWRLRLTTATFIFEKTEWSDVMEPITSKMEFPYDESQIVRSNFDKFFRLDAVAESHSSEPFVKTIVEWPDWKKTNVMRKLQFNWKTDLPIGSPCSSALLDFTQNHSLGVEFDRRDIERFDYSFRFLSDYKRELAEKIRRTEEQESLFK